MREKSGMKSNISGPVAIGVIVVVTLVVVGLLYMRFIREPSVGIEEHKALMQRAGEARAKKMQGLRGGSGARVPVPGAPTGGQ